MNNKMSLLPVKSDFVFRLIFGDQRNVDILSAFLRAVLDIANDEYDHLTIVDPYLKKEFDEVHKIGRRGGFGYAGSEKPTDAKSGRRFERTVGR